MPCRFDCAQKVLESTFYSYGKLISKHPLPFIIIPIVVTFISAIGLLKLEVNDDPEYLYTPTNGPAKQERSTIKKLFTENDSYLFMPTRKTELDGYLNVIISHDSNLFTSLVMDTIIEFDELLRNLSFDNGTVTYSNVCGSWKGKCLDNVIFTILNGTGKSIDKETITYPLHKNIYFLANQLGGVEVNLNGEINSVKTMMLTYFVRYTTESDRRLSDIWLTGIKEYLLQYSNSDITINFQTSLSINEELAKSTDGIMSRFTLTYCILFSFCAVSCTMSDWVRTKVWVVIAGQLAAGMAVVTSLGILCAAGVPFATTVGSMPFLIAGIGIDDMFVILSCWRHTSYTLPYNERMARTMKIAAVSITVTSITDALAFGVGAITVFRAVSLFCAFTGVAVLFSYIYAITFLPACFAISGKREENNRHEITCQKILPANKSSNQSKMYQIFCTGGYIPGNPTDVQPERYSLPIVTSYLKKSFAPFLMKTPVKVIVIGAYCIYLGFAVWGCYRLREEKGLKLRNLALSSSYVIPYYDLEEKYFRQLYGPRTMVAFTQPIDYSSKTVQDTVESQLDEFRKNPLYYSSNMYTESWLSSFKIFLNMTNQNPSDMISFIHILRTQFLVMPPFDVFRLDVTFNKEYTQIIASRFFIQGKGIKEDMTGEKVMLTSREIAKNAEFDITVYHPSFIFLDQFTVIYSNTIQNLAIAVGSMLIVSAVLLPSILSVTCVTLSVISICTGVLGYMVLWDVGLNSVSMINLIMCIGFSVDFSAHISYHFSISEAKTGNLRAIEALGHIGTPILQGALSTILAIVVLSTSQSYIFMVFFKIMLLVMIFGFLHAMFLLPTVLSLTVNVKQDKNRNTNQDKTCVYKNGIDDIDIKIKPCAYNNVFKSKDVDTHSISAIKPNASGDKCGIDKNDGETTSLYDNVTTDRITVM